MFRKLRGSMAITVTQGSGAQEPDTWPPQAPCSPTLACSVEARLPSLRQLSASAFGLPKRECDDRKADASLMPSVQEEHLIVFDWDDTLCPTWWITRVMAAGLAHVDLGQRMVSDPKLATVLKAQKDLSDPNSKFRTELRAHALAVEALMRTARTLGHVSIVTLGSESWFKYSAVFFCGLDIPALLTELDIQVYFATVPQHVPQGMNIRVAAKRVVMAQALMDTYGRDTIRWSAFSIGDQPEESEALRLCCKECPHHRKLRPLCKTLTVPAEPLLEDLTENLSRLTGALPRLISHDRDVDWTLNAALA